MAPEIGVGDVLCVRTPSLVAAAIRLGAALRHLPSSVNHVVIAHHRDDEGVWWGVEGRPGGVGWTDLRPYLASPATIANSTQPRTDEQRARIAEVCASLLGVPYDWRAIAADAADDLGIGRFRGRDWIGSGVPGHLVCSSLAAWVYDREGLAHPRLGRLVQPGDWAFFIEREVWTWPVLKA